MNGFSRPCRTNFLIIYIFIYGILNGIRALQGSVQVSYIILGKHAFGKKRVSISRVWNLITYFYCNV